MTVRDREVRLGIVLYGGVSLAVYENGVAQELFRAVKGEGVYSLIKELTDSDIVVDIVSGTSAGGINGIMLGYALTNDRDFKSCAKLWREEGDILRLLRNPGEPGADSLLDSRGYYQERLQACFEGMPRYTGPANDAASTISEFDLFVTGTDVQGRVFTEFDDQGHPIDVKDHRQVFLLSYRAGRKNEFEPGRAEQLAKLARITSCFPVAFEPVQVQPNEAEDAVLERWGKLNDGRANIFFLDGGVLNNKPFSYTVDTIARRTADRDVERMLLYVEPDPEHFQRKTLRRTPDVVDAAMNAMLGIPGYQSIAGDLQTIADLNDRVQQYRDLQKCVPDGLAAPDCFDSSMANELFQLPPNDPRVRVYLTARLEQLRSRALEGILKEHGAKKLLVETGERHAAKILVESFEDWKGGDETLNAEQQAAVGLQTLSDFDVYYRKRRLQHLCYFIKRTLYPADADRMPAEAAAPYRQLWRRINHQFKLLEMLEFALESAIDQAPIEWKDLADKKASASHATPKWQSAQNVLRAVLDTTDIEGHKGGEDDTVSDDDLVLRRRVFMDEMNDRIQSAVGRNPGVAFQPAGNLLHECDRIEKAVLRRFAPGAEKDLVAQEYCRFVVLDSYLFPMQRLARMEAMDVIHTVRISPIDAKREYSNLALDAKLCGNELGHFGGFLKRSWRANDIMWGRLDAACQLVECLVTKERMERLKEPRKAPEMAKLQAIFPHSEDEALQQLQKQISSLHTYGDDQERWDDFWNTLVRATQREILQEEIPLVVGSAIRQHADWNQFPVHAPKLRFLSNKQVWKVGPRKIDPVVAAYAATKLAAETPGSKGWAEYFESIYAVGGETWSEDIPKPILVEVIAQASMVFRNCLLAVAGPHAKDISRNPVYQIFVNWPLNIAYKFVRLQRTAPEYVWAIGAAAVVASVAVLFVDYMFLHEIVEKEKWMVVLLPLLVLFIVSVLTWLFSRAPRRKRTRRARGRSKNLADLRVSPPQ